MSDGPWVVMAGAVLYASRATREECERLVEEQRGLIERFGVPRIERRVLDFPVAFGDRPTDD